MSWWFDAYFMVIIRQHVGTTFYLREFLFVKGRMFVVSVPAATTATMPNKQKALS